MAPQVLHRVCYGTSKPDDFQKSLLTIRPAMLHSYSRHKVRFCDYPAIVPEHGDSTHQDPPSTVRGTFVKGLTDGDLWRLDIFEGDEYERKSVQVSLLNSAGDGNVTGKSSGEEVSTQTYVWIAGRDKLEEGEWDFDDFVRDKMSRWVGDSDEYKGELRVGTAGMMERLLTLAIDVDVAVGEASADPTGGRGRGGDITEVLEAKGKAHDGIMESAV
jgi:hypothetical protein